MVAFVLFVIAHILLVVVERFPENMGNILLGNGEGVAYLPQLDYLPSTLQSLLLSMLGLHRSLCGTPEWCKMHWIKS